MRDIDTEALSEVAAALGIGNPATATMPTEFDDGVLQQTLDVGSLVSRSRVQGFNQGLGVIVLETEHGGAGTEADSLAVFNTNFTTLYNEPWPARALRDGKYDLWYVDCFAFINGAAGVLTAAELIMSFNSEPGLYTDTFSKGGQVQKLLGYWTLETPWGRLMGPSAIDTVAPRPFRISRAGAPDVSVTLNSTSTGAAAYVAAIRVAIAPAGLTPNAF